MQISEFKVNLQSKFQVGSERVGKQKAGNRLGVRGMFQAQQAEEHSSFGYMAQTLESRIEGTTGTVDAS